MATFGVPQLVESGIIPDVVPEGGAAGLTGDIEAHWATQGAAPLALPEGFTPVGTREPPAALSSSAAEAGKYYTLVMTDPDAPSRASPAFREFCHMVVTNVPGGADDLRAAGEEAVGYLGPGPPYGSGDHRYVFMLFEQKDGAKDDALKASAAAMAEGRGGKKTFAWAAEQGMTLRAVGAFATSWDASVDASHAAMGFAPPPELQSPGQKAAAAGGGAAPSWGVAELTASGIIPDVIPEGSADGAGTVSAKWADLDAAVLALPAGANPQVTAKAPAVSTAAAVDGKFYTVVVTDPDAPSRAAPAFREFCHAVYTNAPGGASDLLAAGEEAAGYLGPGPPYNSGAHRYVVMVFEQKDGAKDDALKASAAAMAEGRGGKKTFAWAAEQGMKLVASGAWEASWEASVDGVHAAMGFAPPPEFQSPSQRAAAGGAGGSA